jgi:hypothetical protein
MRESLLHSASPGVDSSRTEHLLTEQLLGLALTSVGAFLSTQHVSAPGARWDGSLPSVPLLVASSHGQRICRLPANSG